MCRRCPTGHYICHRDGHRPGRKHRHHLRRHRHHRHDRPREADDLRRRRRPGQPGRGHQRPVADRRHHRRALRPPAEAAETITISIDHGTPLRWTSCPARQDITLGPLDLSGLPDGQVSLKMTLTDSDGNITHRLARQWRKETSGPTGPTQRRRARGPGQPGRLRELRHPDMPPRSWPAFDAPTDPADQIALSVGGDSNFPVQSGGGDQATWNNLDLSQLTDGTLPIVVTITDASGNSTSFSGSLIKDTQAPPAPVAAHVLGPPLDTIAPGDGLLRQRRRGLQPGARPVRHGHGHPLRRRDERPGLHPGRRRSGDGRLHRCELARPRQHHA